MQKLTTSHSAVFVCGYAGSGKTEFSRVLAEESGWIVADKDIVGRSLAEEMLVALDLSPHDRESEIYLERVRPKEYHVLSKVVNEIVECGKSVIATAPYLKEVTDHSWMEKREAVLKKLGADVLLIWVECDIETMYNRLYQRGAARDIGKLKNWDEYIKGIDLGLRPAGDHYVIKNSIGDPSLQIQAQMLMQTEMSIEPERNC